MDSLFQTGLPGGDIKAVFSLEARVMFIKIADACQDVLKGDRVFLLLLLLLLSYVSTSPSSPLPPSLLSSILSLLLSPCSHSNTPKEH